MILYQVISDPQGLYGLSVSHSRAATATLPNLYQTAAFSGSKFTIDLLGKISDFTKLLMQLVKYQFKKLFACSPLDQLFLFRPTFVLKAG